MSSQLCVIMRTVNGRVCSRPFICSGRQESSCSEAEPPTRVCQEPSSRNFPVGTLYQEPSRGNPPLGTFHQEPSNMVPHQPEAATARLSENTLTLASSTRGLCTMASQAEGCGFDSQLLWAFVSPLAFSASLGAGKSTQGASSFGWVELGLVSLSEWRPFSHPCPHPCPCPCPHPCPHPCLCPWPVVLTF